jgi:hypothetical protein
MALYIRTPCAPDIDNYTQVTQIMYHDQRCIEIFWYPSQNCTVIQEFGQYFALTSPNIENITINNVIEALGYSNQCINVAWTIDDSHDTLLHTYVSEAPLSQLSINSANNDKQAADNNKTKLNTTFYIAAAAVAEDEDRCYSK